jgi:outer membrane protein OmpA-like peptidoglycan-associated protein
VAPRADRFHQWEVFLMRLSRISILGPIVGLALACGASPQPRATVSSSASISGGDAPRSETPAQARTSGGVQISADIVKACGLSDVDAYFRFDSARLEKQDVVPLNTIAVCFTRGALKGRPVKLVGRADPRGSTEYNMTLGQARADGVEAYLEKRGLDRANVEASSRGAMDATGTDDNGWVHDRRVDLMLAN